MALCECILNNYNSINNDSNFLNDVSKSTFFNKYNIEFKLLEQLDSFVHIKTSNFYELKTSHTVSQSQKTNEVLKLCIEFYNSNELKRFIRKLK